MVEVDDRVRADGCVERLLDLAALEPEIERAHADGIDAVRLLAADCGLPSRLRDVGVPQAAIPSIVDTALTDPAWLNNPRTVTPEQLLEILYTAW